MFKACFVGWTFSIAVMVLGCGMVGGQHYPNKPVRMVTGSIGGGNDFVARIVAQALSVGLGQQVIVDNRVGSLASEIVARAAPDGYTLLLSGGTFVIEPLLRSNVPYNVVRDFLPITLAANAPSILAVHPLLPANSIKELIAVARAKPGELNYGSGPTGGAPHLSAELFKSMAGVNMVRVPYKGTAQALIDLTGGRVQVMFPISSAVAPHVKSGRLRALAVTSARPTELFPGLPTVAASVPGYESGVIYGIFSPAKTPQEIIKRLTQGTVRALASVDVKEKFFSAGLDTVANSPAEAAATIKFELARWGKVIKDAGIREE